MNNNSNNIYSDSFQGARPTSTYNAVASRLRIQKAYTNDLASYFSERAKVQEAYVASLNKLSSRLNSTGSNGVMTSIESLNLDKREEDKQLGAWKTIKIQLEQEVNEQSRIADNWRKAVIETVEIPLRNSLNKPDWLRYQLAEANLGSIVRDYEATVDKVQKAQIKGGTKSSKTTTSKLLSAQSHLSTLGSNLQSSLPSFLQSTESLDISHATFLVEALIRYGTINSDTGREQMETGERLLVSVLSIDPQSEMQGFALREGAKAGAGGVGSSVRNNSISSEAPSIGEFGSRNGSTPAQRIETPIVEEEEVLRAPTTERQRTASIPRSAPPPVASLALPTTAAPTPSPSKSSGFKLSSFMKRDRASSAASTSKYGNLDVPSTSNNASNEVDRQSFDSRHSDLQQPEEPVPSFSRSNSNQSSNNNVPKAERPQSMMFGAKKRDSMMPFGSGSIFRRQSKMISSTSEKTSNNNNNETGGLSPYGSAGDTAGRGRSHSDVQATEEVIPSSESRERKGLGLSTSSTIMSGAGSTVDSEGFSVPPAGYDKQPWESSRGGNVNLMDDDDEDDEDNLSASLPAPKVSTVAIAPITITETSDERRAALERVKTTLLSSKPLAGPPVSPLGVSPGNGVSRRGTTRGRRDNSRMSTYGSGSASPILPDDVPLGKIIEQQRVAREENENVASSRNNSIDVGSGFTPLSSPLTNSTIGLPSIYSGERTERANSMMSTNSSNSNSRMREVKIDPFESSTSPGMRASIIETVNVISKLGVVSRVMVTGELSLSHRLLPGEVGGSVRIKLSNFDKFEKAAPDSTYLAAIADSPGEYLVKDTLGEKTTPVIKYQLRVEEGSEKEFVPLLVKTSWKVEAGKARIMIVYNANSDIKLIGLGDSPFEDSTNSSTKLQNLAFHLPFSLPVTTFQAKPSAQYSPDRARLSFNIEQGVVVGAGAVEDENKLLASVVTEGNGLFAANPVAVQWSIKGKILSGVTLEVVDGKMEEIDASVVSGKYLAL